MSNIRIGLFFLALFLSIFGCKRSDVIERDKTIVCGAEKKTKKGDRLIAENDTSFTFSGGYAQSNKEAHYGKYSVQTTHKNAFALGFTVKPGPDHYFKVSVWRKSKNKDKGVLVASAENAKEFYLATGKPVTTEKNGWQKLEMEFFTPPTFDEKKIKIYVWNNGKDTIYFDDLMVEIHQKKTYPVYKEEPLAVILDTSKYIKIQNVRKRAFENYILQTTDNDWVKAMIFGDGKMMKAKIRLKGDWLDHLQGDKWSFRIKLKKDYAWRRLRTFSVQTPLARGYLMEWVAHKFYDAEDILTTRYGFVPLVLNNRSLGLYAYEEHFVKQLIESRNRREGPITKFTEDGFWQVQKIYKTTGKWQSLPFFEAAVIKPFKVSKTMGKTSLRNGFINASRLMNQYKNGLKPASEIFDIDALAKYYASLELTHARHGMAWHNQRFYYNPVLDRLEPISFDGYTEHLQVDFSIKDNYLYKALQSGSVKAEEALIFRLFADSIFRTKYLDYLKKYAAEGYMDSVLSTFQDELAYNDSLLNVEFPVHSYDNDFYKKSAEHVRKYLPELEKLLAEKLKKGNLTINVKKEHYNDSAVFEDTPEYFVNAYVQKRQGDSMLLLVENYFPRSVILLGTGKKKKSGNFHFVKMPNLKAFRGERPDTVMVWTDTFAQYLNFMIPKIPESFTSCINSWPKHEGLSPRQELMKKVDLSLPLFAKVEGKKIYIKNKKTTVNYPVIIPDGYKVYFDAGTKIDFVDSAFMLSFSPVIMNGKADNPVVISSSDSTSQGFHVLQPKGKNKVSHVRFVNLNTLNYKTWTLTGAVTFYEADVDINGLTIENNQCEDALNTVRSKFVMKNSVFEKTFADAFDSDFSTGTIINTSFKDIGNDAIDFSGSIISIKKVTVNSAVDKGISGGEDSHLKISDVIIKNANIGIASKDLSHLDVENSMIENCKYGLVLLQKKPEYGPATMILKNTIFTDCKDNRLIEKGSSIVFEGKKIEGVMKNVDKMFY